MHELLAVLAPHASTALAPSVTIDYAMTNEELLHNLQQFVTEKIDSVERHLGAQLEALDTKMVRTAESMTDIPEKVARIDGRTERIEDATTVIKAAVKDQTNELDDHAQRLTDHSTRIQRLEHHAA